MEKSDGTGTSGINEEKEGGSHIRVRTGRERKDGSGKGELIRTFPCTRREGAGVDEEVLAIVEQAHSCTREKDRRLIEVIRNKLDTWTKNN
jgi:hypothetical protein